MTPQSLPKLTSAHLGVIPLRPSSWLIAVQANTENERRITVWLADIAKGQPEPPPRPKLVPNEAIPFPSLEANVRVLDMTDTAYLVLVRQGKDGSGPNETEWELMKFMSEHGRKTARPK